SIPNTLRHCAQHIRKKLLALSMKLPPFTQTFNPTATLLEHALLPQGLMGVSKVAFPRRLQLQNRNSTGENLSNAIKCRCRVKLRVAQYLSSPPFRLRRQFIP